MNEFIKSCDFKTFDLSDLVGKTLEIRSFKDGCCELITALDTKTGELFVLKTITHSQVAKT